MEYRNLGRAGLKVSEICLGTMTMGNGADQAEASRMVDTALAAGGTYSLSNGASSRMSISPMT